MAKKTNVAETTIPPKTIPEQMEALRLEIDALKVQYDDSAKFAEAAKLAKIGDEIDAKVGEYQDLSETLCFQELKAAENPMVEAAKRLTYQTIAAKPKREKGKTEIMDVTTIQKPIDPLRLHRRVDGGIGADKTWNTYVERLNLSHASAQALVLGIDPKSIHDSFAMSEEARQLEGFMEYKFNGERRLNMNKVQDKLFADLQLVTDKMLGAGYSADLTYVGYMMSVYAKKDTRQALKVACANHTIFRRYLMDALHCAITGERFGITYKVRKQA